MIEIWRNLLRVFYGNQVDEYTKKELVFLWLPLLFYR
jgi:hypothetical protein